MTPGGLGMGGATLTSAQGLDVMSGPAGGEGRIDNSLAWALALTPVLYIFLDATLRKFDPTTALFVSCAIAIAVNTTLVVLDHRRIRKSGDVPSLWLGIVLVPVYLFRRSSMLRQTQGIPVTWCIAFAVSLAAPVMLANSVGVGIDTSAVEDEIENGIRQQAGISVTAECPGTVSTKPGSSFQCVVEAADGTRAIADVTVQNANGDVVWQVR